MTMHEACHIHLHRKAIKMSLNFKISKNNIIYPWGHGSHKGGREVKKPQVKLVYGGKDHSQTISNQSLRI